MSDRARYYLAGVLHAIAVIWIAGLAARHWGGEPSHGLGPDSWVPAPLALLPALAGLRLLLGGRPGPIGGPMAEPGAPPDPARM